MHYIKTLSRWLVYLFALLAIIIVIAALVLRFAIFPNIDQYKDDLAKYATKTVGQKITIGNIETGWQGISPHIALKNIAIFDAQNRVALGLNNVEASLSWLSIPMLQARLANLSIHAPALTIRRDSNNQLFVAGINMAGESKPAFANWLLSQAEVNIDDAQIIWQDDFRHAPALSLTQLNLTLTNPIIKSLFGQHQFNLTTMPSIGTTQLIKASGRFVGNDISKIHTWHGDAIAALKQADLSVWRPWLDYPIDLQSGMGDAQISVNFAASKIETIKMQAVLNNLSVMTKTQTSPLVATTFSGDVSWSNLKNTQTFTANNFKLISNNSHSSYSGSGYYASSVKNGKPWVNANIKLDQLDLSSIKHVTGYFKLPETVSNQINGLAPVGDLHNLQLSWVGEMTQPEAYKMSAQFKQLGLTAYEKIPGFTNLTGDITADEDGGEITLKTQKATLYFKDILRWSIPANQLTGQISWQIKNKQVSINAKELFITSPHITGTLNASYNLNGVKGGYLDLNGKFSKGDAKYALFYYPLILGDATLHWLDTSILKGRAEDVNVLVKGNLDDFPYVNANNQPDKKLGIFKVTAKISNALLEYGTGWPVIEDLGLNMLFEGKRMLLDANKGRIFGNKITKSRTEIAQLDADSPILHIVSEVEGNVTDGIKFVNESPVKLVTQGFTESLKTAGNGKLWLELNIPMQNLDAAKYRGVYKVSNGTIFANADAGLPELNKLNGILNFTESSLNAQNINTEILGGPAKFSLKTGADKIIRVTANGRLSDAGIKKLSSNMVTDNMQGSANWQANITIKKPLVDLNFSSDLVGMAISLPAPFNKSASQYMPLILDKKQSNIDRDMIKIDYGNVNIGNNINATILRKDEAGNLLIDHGDIGINVMANPSNAAGLSLHAKLDYIDADDWITLFNQSNSKSNASNTTTAISNIDLTLQKLDIFGRRLNALKLLAKPSADGLKMMIDSTEVTGDVNWQNISNINTSGKIIARLKNLTIPNNSVSATVKAVKKDFRKLSTGYPALDVVADNFQIGDKKLGSLELNAYENNDDWVIQKLKIANPDSTLLADGNWHNWTRSPNTKLKFSLNVSNIGNTLKRFGQPDAVKGGDADMTGQLQWPGSPHEFDTLGLSGNLKLDVRKGQFLKVQPGVGRLLGLLSLQSLPRRLSLDFRDLFSDGFAFDKISATASVNNGILRSDDFFMTGPAAEAKIKGETNLKTQTQNLKVQVKPHVSDTLSLAAFAGGPIAGVAAFVAQKLLKDPLNKIAQSEYVIIGTWDNPQEVKSDIDDAQKANTSSPLAQ